MVFCKKRSGFQLNISSLHPKPKSSIWKLNGEPKTGNKTLRLGLDRLYSDFILNHHLLHHKRKAIWMAYAIQGITNCYVLYLLIRFFCLSGADSSSCIHSTTLCEKAVSYVVRFFIYSKASTWSTMHFFPPSSSEAHFLCLWTYRHLFWSDATQSSWHCKTYSSFPHQQINFITCLVEIPSLCTFTSGSLVTAMSTVSEESERYWLTCKHLQDCQTCALTSRTRVWVDLSIHHTVMDVSRINRGVGRLSHRGFWSCSPSGLINSTPLGIKWQQCPKALKNPCLCNTLFPFLHCSQEQNIKQRLWKWDWATHLRNQKPQSSEGCPLQIGSCHWVFQVSSDLLPLKCEHPFQLISQLVQQMKTLNWGKWLLALCIGCLCNLMDHSKNWSDCRIYIEQKIRFYVMGFIIQFRLKIIY